MTPPFARIRRHLPTIIEVVGIIALCAGVLWYSIPAGLIVTGLVAVVVAQGIPRHDAHNE